MDGQDFPGPQFDDGDAGSVGDSEDFPAAVGDADAEVVHLAGPADADLAAGVDVVIAQPVVRGRGGGGPGFGQGPVGLAGDRAVHCPAGAVLVVVLAEDVELALQVAQGGGGRLPGQPAFLGLVESFDLALGLGMERLAVLLGDAQGGKEVLEGVPAAAEAGGADAPVIGEGRGGEPVGVAGLQERVDDDFAGNRGPGAGGEQVAGVVVEPVDDLRAGAAGQRPVGEIGLPALVGQGRFEPEVGGAGPLAGLGGDQAGGVQDPADRRGRRDVQPGLLQVPGDGDGAGVPAGAVSSRRVLTMKSRTLPSVACGLLSGLRDRASTASRPPAR